MGKLHTKILISAFVLFTSFGFYSPMTEKLVYTTVHSDVLSANLSASVVKVSAVSSAYNAITIAWPAVNGASGYEIHYAKGSSTKFVLLSTLPKPGFTHTALSTNTKYTYKIRFYNLSGKTKKYSAFSALVSATPLLAVPTNFTSVSNGPNSIKVSWTAVAGASGYQVSYSSTLAGPYKNLSNVSSTSTKLNTAKPNETIYFKIRAYRSIWFTNVYGAVSAPITGKALPAAPTVSAKTKLDTVSGLKVVSTSITSIALSWTAVKGATGYEISSSSSTNGTYTKVATSLTPTTTVNGLKFNTNYYFKIKAFTTTGKVVVSGNTSKAISGKTTPSKVVLTATPASSTSIQLSWTAQSGMSGYEIYYSSGMNSNLFLKTVTTNTFIHTALKNGVNVVYKIRPFKLSGNTKIYGPFSSAVTSAPSSTKAELLKVTNKQLISLIAKVSSKGEKALLQKLSAGIDRLLIDPKYNPSSDVNAAWAMYNKLSNTEKTDLIVKGSITMNLDNLKKIKALYGL